ncbi:MAG: hypothetical protein ABSF60_05375, partial [Verrucomicrobiota bacterium]
MAKILATAASSSSPRKFLPMMMPLRSSRKVVGSSSTPYFKASLSSFPSSYCGQGKPCFFRKVSNFC